MKRDVEKIRTPLSFMNVRRKTKYFKFKCLNTLISYLNNIDFFKKIRSINPRPNKNQILFFKIIKITLF
jgi:hypothetical protein